jgi:cell division protein ZapA
MRGDESTAHMQAVADHVDDKMKEVAERNPRLDAARLAVLSAVNISDDYLKLKQEFHDLLELIDEK